MDPMQPYKDAIRRHHAHVSATRPDFTYAESMEAIAVAFDATNYRALSAAVKSSKKPDSVAAATALTPSAPADDVDQWYARAMRAEALLYSGASVNDVAAYFRSVGRDYEADQVEDLRSRTKHDYTGHRYVYGDWGHLFGPASTETIVRFCFDKEVNAIVRMEAFDNAGRLRATSRAERLDVQESLLGANDGAFEKPGDWNLISSDTPPGHWDEMKFG
jgi:hypothetical protein